MIPERTLMQILKWKTTRITGVVIATLTVLIVLLSISEMYTQSKVPVSPTLRHIFVDLWDKGYVSATGTWIAEGSDDLHDRINMSQVVCHADRKECTDSRASVNSINSGTPHLHINQDVHQITSWSDEMLVYKSGTPCVEYVYTLSRATKQLTGARTLRPGADPGQCGGLAPRLAVRMGEGNKEYWSSLNEARPVALNITALVLVLLIAARRVWRIVKEPRGGQGVADVGTA